MTQYEALVEEMRANLLENVYAGVICGVNDKNEEVKNDES